MKTTKLVWVGIRTTDFGKSVRFFRDVMGMTLHELDENKEFAWFKLESGQSFELFGPADQKRAFMTGPVLGFQVEDVRAARREMEAAGVEFITEVREARGSAWCYFKGPSGEVLEITEGLPKE